TVLHPARLDSGFKTGGNLSSLVKASNIHQNWLRKSLVVAQFSISIEIVVDMLFVQLQVNFFKSIDVGVDADSLIRFHHVYYQNNVDALKTEVKRNPNVTSLSISNWLPTEGAGYMVRAIDDPRNPGEKTELWYIAGDPNLAETLGLTLTDGRFLNSGIPSD